VSNTLTSTCPMIVRRPTALAVLAVAQFIIALDYSIIYVALPSVARDLALDPAVAQWVISAYAVFFAGFLMVGGRLADRVGAQRLFIGAITLFGVTSAIGGAAHDGPMLLAARGAQGVGAALLQPAILGLIGTTFPAGPSRSRAMAVWGGRRVGARRRRHPRWSAHDRIVAAHVLHQCSAHAAVRRGGNPVVQSRA